MTSTQSGGPTATDRERRHRALCVWRSGNGMDCIASDVALDEAATLATLVETSRGWEFEPTAFRELAEFIDELPF